ncbi:MAG: TerB family tellurite resistance protein [Comamonadaceae bacterium]|nr:MAG: TerB family tellurite resistance protein [Comamonadaceae bacterium]
MPTVQDQSLTPAQVVQLTQAMLAVAAIDGIHPAETALVSQFYESSRAGDMPDTSSMMANADKARFKPETLAGVDAAFADTLVLMCLMSGYADGKLSDAERNYIQSLATAAGMKDDAFGTHLAQVRDELTGALSHLPDAASVAAVVGKL